MWNSLPILLLCSRRERCLRRKRMLLMIRVAELLNDGDVDFWSEILLDLTKKTSEGRIEYINAIKYVADSTKNLNRVKPSQQRELIRSFIPAASEAN